LPQTPLLSPLCWISRPSLPSTTPPTRLPLLSTLCSLKTGIPLLPLCPIPARLRASISMAQNPDAFFGFRSPSPEPEDAPALADCPLSNGHFQLTQALVQDTGAYVDPSIITSAANYHDNMGLGQPLVPSQTTETGLLTWGPAGFTSGQAGGVSPLDSQHHPDLSLQTHEHPQAQLNATWDVMDVDSRSDIADVVTMHDTSFDPSSKSPYGNCCAL